GSAPAGAGIGQGFGGQNYDGRGRIRLPEAGTTSASQRGRGPKGWKRSDQRIADDVCELLYEDEHVDAGGVVVTCSEGLVTLEGEVDGRWEKRHLENLAATARGVVDVRNRLRVASGPRPDAED